MCGKWEKKHIRKVLEIMTSPFRSFRDQRNAIYLLNSIWLKIIYWRGEKTIYFFIGTHYNNRLYVGYLLKSNANFLCNDPSPASFSHIFWGTSYYYTYHKKAFSNYPKRLEFSNKLSPVFPLQSFPFSPKWFIILNSGNY